MIHFGTSGWRGILADDFTFANVRRVTQAIAEHLLGTPHPALSSGERQSGAAAPSREGRPVVVGYDPRFLSPEFAQTAAQVLAGNGIPVLLSKEAVPTPAVSYQVLHQKAAGAINFTASHNPAEYNGLKFNMANGAPASKEVTTDIERRANEAAPEHRGVGASATADGSVGRLRGPHAPTRLFDPRPAYLARLRRMVDADVLRKARLKLGVDCLYGAGMGYLDRFLEDAGLRPRVLHNWRDVRFGGMAPEPAREQLGELIRAMKQERLQAGLATDGDADRFGVVDEDGTLLSPNEILPIVLSHLVKRRRLKGLVVRSVMTSHFIDAVARHFGLPLKETPVGFKYIAEAMEADDFLLGGEESGGLTIQGHVPEKDGVLACLLMAEVRAVERKPFRKILSDLRREVGPFYSDRINLRLPAERMQAVRRRMETFTPNAIGPLRVEKIVRLDGFKFIFEDQSWMGVRLSGTEPVVRLYVESDRPGKLRELEKFGKELILK